MSVKPESEEPSIIAYAAANGINATKHSSGLYYEIINQGSGVTPNPNSRVWITYVGRHLNGSVFYQATVPTTFNDQLKGLIKGWEIGLQLIQKGGIIKLIVPSSLAYGCAGNDIIAPNEVLYYEVHLIDVQ